MFGGYWRQVALIGNQDWEMPWVPTVVPVQGRTGPQIPQVALQRHQPHRGSQCPPAVAGPAQSWQWALLSTERQAVSWPFMAESRTVMCGGQCLHLAGSEL